MTLKKKEKILCHAFLMQFIVGKRYTGRLRLFMILSFAVQKDPLPKK